MKLYLAADVAEMKKVSRQSVDYLARKYKLGVRVGSMTVFTEEMARLISRDRRGLTPASLKALYTLEPVRLWGVEELAREMGVDKSTVWRIANKIGVGSRVGDGSSARSILVFTEEDCGLIRVEHAS